MVPDRRRRLACKYFYLQSSFGCSVNIYTKDRLIYLFMGGGGGGTFLWIWTPWGAAMLIHSLPMKNRKKVVSWRISYFYHTFRACSLRHWQTTHSWAQNGRTQGRVSWFSNVNKDHKSIEKPTLYLFSFYSIPIDKAGDADSFPFPFNWGFSFLQSFGLSLLSWRWLSACAYTF